jgi:drug/metabolite transporter, DME family
LLSPGLSGPPPRPHSLAADKNLVKGGSGYFFVVLAAVLWACSGTAAKFLFQRGITPFQLVQLRTTLAAGVLFTLILLRQPEKLKIARSDAPPLLLLGISLAGAQFTYLYAISKINVAAAILLQYQAPVFIAVYSAVFAHKRPGWSTTAAILSALAGCYLVVGAYSLDILSMNRAGIISGLSSALTFAWYSVQSEYSMKKYGPWTVLFYAILFAAIFWNILYQPFEAFTHGHNPETWGWIFFVGVFGTVLPFGLYNEGIRRISPTHASITATLEPITAAAISYLVLNEVMYPSQFAGAGLVIGSIILLQATNKSR